MRLDLARAVREAAALTRSQKLVDATRVIQEALSGSPSTVVPSASRSDHPGQDPAKHEPREIPTEPDRTLFAGKLGPRPKWSLSDVVKTLGRVKHPEAMRLAAQTRGRRESAIVEGAQFLSRSFAGATGGRGYKLYLPAGRDPAGLPFVVMLHGCTQNPDDFAVGTRMNALAEEVGFLVAYPCQPAMANPSSCWNWFEPKHQTRTKGEPSIIAGITNGIVAEYRLDRRRIFVAGMSAGGAMAAVMGATYPDIFSAIGVHSGLAYGSASDAMSAFAAMRGEFALRAPPLSASPATPRRIVFHGDADRTVHPTNGEQLVRPSKRPGDTEETELGTTSGRSFIRTITRDPEGKTRSEHWLVAGAGHAWSGGNSQGSYADAAGPDASREMLRFFLEPQSVVRD